MAEGNRPPVEAIVAEYGSKFTLYSDFTSRCETLVRQLLSNAGLAGKVASVESRTKKVERVRSKCNRPDSEYGKLADITDLSGVRITTFYADDVDRVGSLIEDEFKPDPENSIDKRKILAPDRFGYLSLHYVCWLTPAREGLTEYEAFKGLVVEIQVRSILQHAWAAIERDLGYDRPEGIPDKHRRSFSRLAGLLELADDEFVRLRDELTTYEADVITQIQKEPSSVEINKASLEALAMNDPLVADMDSAFREAVPGDWIEEPGHAEDYVLYLRDFGLETIADVQAALQTNRRVVEQFFGPYWGDTPGRVHRGITLMALFYVLLASSGNAREVEERFSRLKGRDPADIEQWVSKILEAFREATSNDDTHDSSS